MKKHQKAIFEQAQEEPAISDEHRSTLIRHFDIFSSITTESVYVLDIPQNRFCYVKLDDFFLCGYPVKDALKEGVEFYSKIVYPEDLLLWKAMYKAVLQYLKKNKEKRDKIDCFSCTFRLQRKYSFISRPLPQMIYHRMNPLWENDELRYLICSTMGSSTIKEAGNLHMYHKDGLTYEEYNLITKRWKYRKKVLLTERERAILILAGQGKSPKEIANNLCKGHNTIRNQVKALFSKLGVHSIQEAIEFASCYRLIYPKQNVGVQPIERCLTAKEAELWYEYSASSKAGRCLRMCYSILDKERKPEKMTTYVRKI
jgi:DNA-binding CsgD family transcriptional regulator